MDNENKAQKKTREALFHIIKRPQISLQKALLIRIVAIISALVFAGIITLILLKENPFTAYGTMFKGVFGLNTRDSLRSTAILLCIALALTPAFKMRFWNTGAEGQVLMGCLGTAAAMFYFGHLPTLPLVLLMLLFALTLGALWGVIPAIFKAYWGTNETLFTLMLNSVAAFLILLFKKSWNRLSEAVDKEILDKESKINDLFGNNHWLVIGIVLVLAVVIYVYLNYSKHGYEISVVGESENTANYIGINVKKVIIRTMLISGLICGLAGFLIISISQTVASNAVGGQGFTAIMVAWLAKFNPLIMILSAFLFIFFDRGGQQISTTLGYSKAYSGILIGILLFFIIGCEFFINYKIVFNRSKKKEEE